MRRVLVAVLLLSGLMLVTLGRLSRAIEYGPCPDCSPQGGGREGPFNVSIATQGCLGQEADGKELWAGSDGRTTAAKNGTLAWNQYTDGRINGVATYVGDCNPNANVLVRRQANTNEPTPIDPVSSEPAIAWWANPSANNHVIVLRQDIADALPAADLQNLLTHEFGHALGFSNNNQYWCRGTTVMYFDFGFFPTGGLTYRDQCGAQFAYRVGDYVPNTTCYWFEWEDCPGWFDFETCECNPTSPILISLTGRQFDLSSPDEGVLFDINGDGRLEQTAWPKRGEAGLFFLAMDRDGDGAITSGQELFGNATEQPSSPTRNGFAALAIYDQPINGGNDDGWITRDDRVWTSLRLWCDLNHNGVSEYDEVTALAATTITGISLNVTTSGRRDPDGNMYRYASKVLLSDRPSGAAYDVYLRTQTR